MEAPPRTRPSRRPSRRAPRRPVDRREPPTTDENAAGEHVGPPRRLQPAGVAFLVGLCALLLGALLNAPGLHKTAESLNPGWQRDVALGLTGHEDDQPLPLPRSAAPARQVGDRPLGRRQDRDGDQAPPPPPPTRRPAVPPAPVNQKPSGTRASPQRRSRRRRSRLRCRPSRRSRRRTRSGSTSGETRS